VVDDLLVLWLSLFALGKLGNLAVPVFIDNATVDEKVAESHDVLRKGASFVREDVVDLKDFKIIYYIYYYYFC